MERGRIVRRFDGTQESSLRKRSRIDYHYSVATSGSIGWQAVASPAWTDSTAGNATWLRNHLPHHHHLSWSCRAWGTRLHTPPRALFSLIISLSLSLYIYPFIANYVENIILFPDIMIKEQNRGKRLPMLDFFFFFTNDIDVQFFLFCIVLLIFWKHYSFSATHYKYCVKKIYSYIYCVNWSLE